MEACCFQYIDKQELTEKLNVTNMNDVSDVFVIQGSLYGMKSTDTPFQQMIEKLKSKSLSSVGTLSKNPIDFQMMRLV